MKTMPRFLLFAILVLTCSLLLLQDGTTKVSAKTTADPAAGVNADKVDGIHAARVPQARKLLALDNSAQLPLSVIPWGVEADTLDGFHADFFLSQMLVGQGPVANPLPTNQLVFLGSVPTVTVGAHERITVMGSAALGSTTGAGSLRLDICTQQGSLPVMGSGAGGLMGLTIPAGTRQTFSMTSQVEPGAGTFKIGLCGQASDTHWNWNDYGYTSIIVAKANSTLTAGSEIQPR